jgi:hypothetical protein
MPNGRIVTIAARTPAVKNVLYPSEFFSHEIQQNARTDGPLWISPETSRSTAINIAKNFPTWAKNQPATSVKRIAAQSFSPN